MRQFCRSTRESCLWANWSSSVGWVSSAGDSSQFGWNDAFQWMIRLAKGPFLESPENFSRPRKAIRKISTRLFCLAALFICVVKGMEIKITAKFRASPEKPSFWRYKQNYVIQNYGDTNRILKIQTELCHPNAPENCPDFRETVPSFDKWWAPQVPFFFKPSTSDFAWGDLQI